MTQAIGHGSKFETGNGATPTEVFTAVNGVMSIDLGSNKVDALDTTDMGTAGIQRTFIGGLENSGDVSVKINALPGDATQATLFTQKDGTLHNFKAIYPASATTISFTGIITSIDEAIPDDKLPTYTIKIQVSGPKVRS